MTRRIRFRNAIAAATFMALAALILSGCKAVHVKAEVDENPLPQVAEAAESKYYVTWRGDNRLELWAVDTSALLHLLWSTVHANLEYEEGTLQVEFYHRLIGPWTLFYHVYLAEPTDGGGLFIRWYNPWMKAPLEEILEWAGLNEGEYQRWVCRKGPRQDPISVGVD